MIKKMKIRHFECVLVWVMLTFFGQLHAEPEPMDWSEKRFRFLAQFEKPLIEDGISGAVRLEFRVYTDGDIAASLVDEVSRIKRDKYKERALYIALNDHTGWALNMVTEIEQRCKNLPIYETDDERKWLIDSGGRAFSFSSNDMASKEFKEVTDLIHQKMEEMFSKFEDDVKDRGLLIESDNSDTIDVDIEELLANQAAYHGKRISVKGYLIYGACRDGYCEGEFFPSPKGTFWTETRDYAQFIDLGTTAERQFDGIEPRKFTAVTVSGTFYRGVRDATKQFAGRLRRIQVEEIH